MCNIAGYTGSRQAAPILVEMLRREEYIDGGVCTGLATIDNGKLYYTKVVGNVDVLLETTDVLNFPGTVGIAHSRPGGTLASQAHPFVDRDEKLALVLNGTLRDVGCDAFFEHSRSIMQGFLDRGFPIRSAVPSNGGHKQLSNGMAYHDTEPYALMTGDFFDGGMSITDALAKALSELPADIVTMCIQVDNPGVVTMGKLTRPVTAGIADGETYLSTTAIAFPEDVEYRAVISLPTATVGQATPGGFAVSDAVIENVRVEDITHKMAARSYQYLEGLLTGCENEPKSVYDFGYYTELRDIWSEPYVDCKFVKDGGLLKPSAALMYETLYAFYKEGRLHMTLGERNGKAITKFWIDGEKK